MAIGIDTVREAGEIDILVGVTALFCYIRDRNLIKSQILADNKKA